MLFFFSVLEKRICRGSLQLNSAAHCRPPRQERDYIELPLANKIDLYSPHFAPMAAMIRSLGHDLFKQDLLVLTLYNVWNLKVQPGDADTY